MGNHRADVVVDTHPSEVTPQPGSYVGKRRAAVPETPAEVAPAQVQPYVGKRRAAVPAEEPAVSAAAPLAVVEAAPSVGVPAPRRTVEESTRVDAPDTDIDVEPLTGPAPTDASETIWTDLRIDTGSLPPFDETAAYATDFSTETTSTIPAVPGVPSGRRRAAGPAATAHPLVKRLPSAPLALGIASLAIAVGGAVTAAHAPAHDKSQDTLLAASALSGASDVGQVGTRSATVSRSSNRNSLVDQAASAAEERAATLKQINTKAAAVDQWKAANQWGLPIPAGVYHLTGRFNDVSGLWASVHTGLDFACPTGTPIHAVAGGTITEVGWAGAYGNRTVETLPDGTELWYAHQVRFGATVGEKVTEGEVIGYVGSTGNTTGPHVHLEVRPGGGDPVDPDTALKAHGIDPDANQ